MSSSVKRLAKIIASTVVWGSIIIFSIDYLYFKLKNNNNFKFSENINSDELVCVYKNIGKQFYNEYYNEIRYNDLVFQNNCIYYKKTFNRCYDIEKLKLIVAKSVSHNFFPNEIESLMSFSNNYDDTLINLKPYLHYGIPIYYIIDVAQHLNINIEKVIFGKQHSLTESRFKQHVLYVKLNNKIKDDYYFKKFIDHCYSNYFLFPIRLKIIFLDSEGKTKEGSIVKTDFSHATTIHLLKDNKEEEIVEEIWVYNNIKPRYLHDNFCKNDICYFNKQKTSNKKMQWISSKARNH